MKFATFMLAVVGTSGVQSSGWHAPPPEAYLDPVDRRIAETGVGVPGRPYPCTRQKAGSNVVVHLPTEQCVKMLPAERWRGLWRDDFEGSRFCPAPATTCDGRTAGDRIWLNGGMDDAAGGGVYAVEFIGRRTMYEGAYGHMGMSDHEIVVDRFISIDVVEAPPHTATKRTINGWWKRCQADGNCISLENARRSGHSEQ